MAVNITEAVLTSPVYQSTEIELSNWTIFTSSNDTESGDFDPTKEVRRMMRVIALPPIIILGTIGNLLTFITMQRGSLKSMSTCFYMAILGVADIGAFHFYILLIMKDNFQVHYRHKILSLCIINESKT